MANADNIPKRWVLVRGLLRSTYHWQEFPNLLKQNLNLDQVTSVELLGNGYQNHRDTPMYVDDALVDLREQVKNIPKPFGLLGISLGGMLATRWAQLHADEVSCLVLINSSSSESSFYQRLRFTNYAKIVKLALRNNPEKFEKFVLETTSNVKEKWQPLLNDYIQFNAEHPIKKMNFIRQLNMASQIDFKQVPTCPKLVLAAQNDRLVHHSCSEQIANTWGCEIKTHPTAGHDLPLDDAGWIIGELVEFLKK